ncbi:MULTISPECIES: 2-hydroxychromene-2-carboxylate isomerase [Microvirga]|uniref:2-hydroxychromene-2-carboxylate isomerase n=1 Tax=Microvirga TaxID=186650 RepID=UPI001CFF7F3B|nr:2-hydroxychromene-2-carboxylate isomerase [Microvirga lenta]MCB5174940.1 2-hydroxychromene-2-carboxylate isomerase [Microvirga lenta]
MRRPILEFWYDFASTYSYLAAMRIEAAAEEAGVGLAWRPFLLGPIFAAQGWTTSPFNLYPEKGRYMWRDMEREAARLDLPFCRPEPFPQNSLLAARVALVGAEAGWTPAFTKAVFLIEFGKGRNISDPVLLAGILADLGLDADAVIGEAQGDANKARLRRMGEEAQARGIFGAPAFVAEDREMFWGNDRLERALEWAAEHGRRSEWPV